MIPPNTSPALIALFQADPQLIPLVSTRVYGQEMPNAATNAAAGAVLFQDTGGRDIGTKIFDGQVDVLSYAVTPAQAKDIQRVCIGILKSINRYVRQDVIIYSADMLAGPRYDKDKELKLPYYYSVWIIKSSYMSMS